MAETKRTRSSDKRQRKSREEVLRDQEEKRAKEEARRLELNKRISERLTALSKTIHGKVYSSLNLDPRVPITASFRAEHPSLLANSDHTIIPISPGNIIQIDASVKDPQYMDRCIIVIGDKYAVAVRSGSPGVDYVRTEMDATTMESAEVRTDSNYILVGKIVSIIDMSTDISDTAEEP